MLIRGSVQEFETCPDLLYLRPTLRVFDAFLSYARADDKAFVAGLYARLTAAGFRIWFDEQEMPSRGETFLREIQHAIDESERLIAVVGPAALASDYVRAEWDYVIQSQSEVAADRSRRPRGRSVDSRRRHEEVDANTGVGARGC